MRLALIAIGLLVLAACATPSGNNQSTAKTDPNLNRFTEPTNGAAYSQADQYDYLQAADPGQGGTPHRK
jgi:hypothetical protein